MAQSIFAKIKAKLKKEPSEDEELEEFEEGSEEEEEEDEVPSSSLMDKVKAQLPFLSKLLGKKAAKVDEYDDDEEEDTGEFQAPNNLGGEDPKATKTAIADDYDKTGDIDVSALGEDIDVDHLDEELDDEEEGLSKADQIKAKLAGVQSMLAEKLPFLAKVLNKKSASSQSLEDEEEEDEEEDSSKETPKKKIKVIHIVIGAVLIIGVATEFMPSEETPSKPVLNPIKKVKPVVKDQAPAQNDEAKPATKTAETPPPNDVNPDSPQVVDNGGNEKLNEMFPEDKLETPTENQAVPVKEPEVASDDASFDPPSDEPIAQPIDLGLDGEKNEVVNNEQPVGEVDNSEEVVDVGSEMNSKSETKNDSIITDAGTDINDLNQQYGIQGNESANSDQNKDEVDLTGDLNFGNKLSDTILKDLEKQMKNQKEQMKKNKVLLPTDPPDYENLGRGLVYNCAGLHWACVDKVSYEECEKNNAWNTQQSKHKECVPVQVYSDRDDCEIVQQHKIDTVEKTDFCRL